MDKVEDRFQKDDKYTESFIDKISSLCSKSIELDACLISMWRKNLVYMALGEHEVLYVGMTTQGLCRVFDRNHHTMTGAADQVKSIMLFETKTERDAQKLEMLLIREFRPRLNVAHCKKKRRAA